MLARSRKFKLIHDFSVVFKSGLSSCLLVDSNNRIAPFVDSNQLVMYLINSCETSTAYSMSQRVHVFVTPWSGHYLVLVIMLALECKGDCSSIWTF